jgi:uncharacterized protein YbjT (DUF2867 family)
VRERVSRCFKSWANRNRLGLNSSHSILEQPAITMSTQPQDLILITCASGKQASHLLPLLIAEGFNNLRLAVNSSASYKNLKTLYPTAEVVKADLNDPHQVSGLFYNVSTAYYVGPSIHHHETQCGYIAIDAATAEKSRPGNKFKHFIFSSVLNTQYRKLLNHDCKRYVEEYLFESGLDYTVLQPGNFIDMFPMASLVKQMAENPDEEPTYHAPWDPSVANSLIMLEDLAALSIKVIKEREGHFFAQYPVVSTMPMPYTNMVTEAEKSLGTKIKIERPPFQARVNNLVGLCVGGEREVEPANIDVAERLILWYERHGLNGNPKVLEALLGRRAMTVHEWMEKQAAIERKKFER